MKINLTDIRIPPANIDADCCIFKITEEVEQWIEHHNLDFDIHPKGYYNIRLPEKRKDWINLININSNQYYEYLLDGFSPNLNKDLHVGHLSNLVYASAIQNLTSIRSISILNDTDNHPNKKVFEHKFDVLCSRFNYSPGHKYYASEMSFNSPDSYKSKNNQYKDCTVIDLPKAGTKVLYKSDGSSTYLCQDLGLARYVGSPLLYLTGSEQISHFEAIQEMFPKNKHFPIGLVTLDGEKISSRKGNVILIEELLQEYDINTLKDTFLKYNISTFKNNLKIKQGLSRYMREIDSSESWNTMDNRKLSMAFLIAYNTTNPSFFYNSLQNGTIKDISIGLSMLGYKL